MRRLRGQLPRGQRGRPGDRRATSRSSRSSRRSIEGILNTISTVGAMTEAEDAAVDLVESLRERLGAIEEHVQARRDGGRPVAAGRRPRVARPAVRRRATGCPSRSGAPAAGSCSAPTATGRCETTWDAVAEVDPEMLLLMPCGFHLARDASTSGRGRRGPPGYDDLTAVRRGQVFALDGSAYFSRPGPRVIDGIELLAEIFDPEAFVDIAPIGSWTPVDGRRPVRCRSARRSTACGAAPATPAAARTTSRAGRSSAPDCVGKAGDNGFLRFRLHQALTERGAAGGRRRRPRPPTAAAADAPPRPPRRRRAPPRTPTPTPSCSPTTRPARPSTTTGICAAAATRAVRVHDAAWNAELDVAGRWLDALPIARRDRRARRRHRLVVAAARREGRALAVRRGAGAARSGARTARRASAARAPPRARRLGRAGPRGRRASSPGSG